MKAGKEEKKMGPMFPRLHVNDADKGGPRAPPRNKMAMYDELSIQPQRFSSSAPPPPPVRLNGGPITSTTPPVQGGGHQKSVLSPPLHVSHNTTSHPIEEVHSHSPGSENHVLRKNEPVKRSGKNVNNNVFVGTGSVVECSSHQVSKATSSSTRQPNDDDDDFAVPTFVESGNTTCSSNGEAAKELKLTTPSHVASPEKIYSSPTDSPISPPNNSFDKSFQHLNSHKKIRKNEGIQCEQSSKAVPCAGTGERKSCDSSLVPEYRSSLNAAENENRCNHGADHVDGNCSYSANRDCLNDAHFPENGHVLNVSESCPNTSLRGSYGSIDAADTCSRESAQDSGFLKDEYKNGEVSDASNSDSVSGLEISPDDVVDVIGPKQFWKARRAFVHQQRVFALQVFELHRLIKVQKLIAASPHLLLEDYSSMVKSAQKMTAKIPPAECKSQTKVVDRDVSQKLNQNPEDLAEKSMGTLQVTTIENGPDGGPVQTTGILSYPGKSLSVPAQPENRPNSWVFHPAANQWLIPVVSPSEGLIYKPYTGSHPQTSGFMTPVYGSSVLTMPSYVSTPHYQQNMGVLPGSAPITPNYFPSPYGIPTTNPVVSGSTVEQVNSKAGIGEKGQTDGQSRNSCNSNPKGGAYSSSPWKFHAPGESDVHGSTGSSPCEKVQGARKDGFPIFPMVSAVEGPILLSKSCSKDITQHRIIKVVPHNARAATESAARIFRSIQEERKQYDA